MGARSRPRPRRDDRAGRPPDLVDRNFTADRPNQLWLSDLTYVATWAGFVYVAFVVDCFSRKIVGWRASTSLRTDLAMDALEQAIYDRLDGDAAQAALVHHSDAGSQLGLKGSLQHLEMEVVRHVQTRACAGGQADARQDVVAGSSVHGATRGPLMVTEDGARRCASASRRWRPPVGCVGDAPSRRPVSRRRAAHRWWCQAGRAARRCLWSFSVAMSRSGPSAVALPSLQ